MKSLAKAEGRSAASATPGGGSCAGSSNEHQPPCPICEGSGRFLAATKSGFDLVSCTMCGLVFSVPLPLPDELEAYYQGFTYARPSDHHLRTQIEYTEAGVDRVETLLRQLSGRPIQTVLDYGGGLGFFTYALHRQFPAVTHFDLDEKSREFAREQFEGPGIRIATTHEEALIARYDLILLNQVIEHVPNPIRLLESVARSLNPGGLLVVTTPNNRANDTFARPDVVWHYSRLLKAPIWRATMLLFARPWLCCDPPRHLYAFNQANLIKAGELAGLRAVDHSCASFLDDPFGQPKYRFSGVTSVRNTLNTALYLFTAITGRLARAIDRNGRRGSTLIVFFSQGDAQ